MYSNHKNVLQLLALLKAYEIQQVVLSPGSRNSPITHSLVADPYFICHTVVDERSAGFYTLGIILQTGKPAAVCCTSGTAVLNLGSAVAEAYYMQLPMLLITADRPAAWIGQMAGQTLPQPGIFNTLVRKSVQLPEIATAADEWYCNRLINEALQELNHYTCGPVQINVPLSEPLFEYTEIRLPEVRKINRCMPQREIDEQLEKGGFGERFKRFGRRMIVVGQLLWETDTIRKVLEVLAEDYDCVILAEQLSNIQSPYITAHFDEFLYTLAKEEKAVYAPDLLITFGGHLVSKRVKQFLQSYPPEEHWHISPSGEIVDLFQCLTHLIEADPAAVLDYLASYDTPDNNKPYGSQWGNAVNRLPAPEIKDFSDLRAIQFFMETVPADSVLHLANSSSVRLAQLFPVRKKIRFYCNRGTSGIDGCMSTAVGYASVSNQPTFLLIGDLAFFYDMNALWNKQLNRNLRILLNNNGGGEIFYALPGLNKSEALDTYISASHQTSAKAWAESAGVAYLSVSNEEELTEKMPLFIDNRSNKPILMEVFTSMDKNTEILRNYYHELKRK
ncbi:2-succinyl-5-enolpyruvyl-6-hydroxy-3-cyclohexene-1-carboxylate synthase [Parabacteroides sp. PF5-5]|uniref:2-succinyl-5-enolpyruvyl-6-hydroxy-3- cyclohexene-1-carboxylic-acid synthase n=1 Tax=unclassified Parabacteroides TaxID=2649774 RepID=UPI0024764954|nr:MULTISPECIES: 2-succinyl-5-enolpyruvyl-6-hydroxy-3-cyclohexene-1-carboxylic-acid synthase [unclassified Parabacteroides]MDH6304126.1 2-succinyl-5-enolpyruvyl-6-hydroxy-3-cyclohexene-1-carboxylate synthase [Parabacteroides sp. PH5-39]MDH6315174.1 2-succinyl-5-enolpyruvyl-6-hydroxy-3-cyclohexene-1-carboxylate synthase [Parabacteroides sp. PF5-13]MDH6318819.1 2-succinyl-5-enolpyruvyl-6-hydroxy-3-cyclohexene-1-carboxylate synthase [Parabacteroides sp. PH5-13]MDH6322548.1 2-succinyl-5-enolpyruvyl